MYMMLLTSVSAVGLVGVLRLNRADSNFGWSVWAESSNSAAHGALVAIFLFTKKFKDLNRDL